MLWRFKTKSQLLEILKPADGRKVWESEIQEDKWRPFLTDTIHQVLPSHTTSRNVSQRSKQEQQSYRSRWLRKHMKEQKHARRLWHGKDHSPLNLCPSRFVASSPYWFLYLSLSLFHTHTRMHAQCVRASFPAAVYRAGQEAFLWISNKLVSILSFRCLRYSLRLKY